MTPAERDALYAQIMAHVTAWLNRHLAQTERRRREREHG